MSTRESCTYISHTSSPSLTSSCTCTCTCTRTHTLTLTQKHIHMHLHTSLTHEHIHTLTPSLCTCTRAILHYTHANTRSLRSYLPSSSSSLSDSCTSTERGCVYCPCASSDGHGARSNPCAFNVAALSVSRRLYTSTSFSKLFAAPAANEKNYI